MAGGFCVTFALYGSADEGFIVIQFYIIKPYGELDLLTFGITERKVRFKCLRSSDSSPSPLRVKSSKTSRPSQETINLSLLSMSTLFSWSEQQSVRPKGRIKIALIHTRAVTKWECKFDRFIQTGNSIPLECSSTFRT